MKAAILSLSVLTFSASGQPVVVTIGGLDADYEVRSLEGFGLSAQDGSDPTLSVVDDQTGPVSETRAILQFDLDDLGFEFSSINSVTLRLTLESIENFPAQPVGIWGSSALRTGAVLETDAGAVDEFGAASYGLIQGDAIVVTDPLLTDVVYDIDVTAFVAARLAEFGVSPAASVMLFRAEVFSGFGAEFYNLYSANGPSEFRPMLIVDGVAVPAPASMGLLGLVCARGLRRRR